MRIARLSHVECTKGMCKCGDDQCANMRFQKRTYPKLKVVPAGGKGFGVLAGENISQGQFVIEYVGANSSLISPFTSPFKSLNIPALRVL